VVAGLFVQGHRTFTSEQFDRYRNWYGINRDELEDVQAARLSNAVVFVIGEEWTDVAPFMAQNDPYLENDVIYARYISEAYNQRLMAIYPDRAFWIYRDGELRRFDP